MRRCKLASFFFLVVLFCQGLVASQCDIYKELATKEFPDVFWKRLADIDPTDRVKVDKLLAEFDVPKIADIKPGTIVTVGSGAASTPKFTITNNAKTSIKRLRSNKAIQKKFDEFLEIARNGFQKITEHSHGKGSGWKMHPLKMDKNMFTIRLDHGNRVQFKKLKDGFIEIVEVGNQVTH